MECPLGNKTYEACKTCPFQKQDLCDYPYIGAEKMTVVGNEDVK